MQFNMKSPEENYYLMHFSMIFFISLAGGQNDTQNTQTKTQSLRVFCKYILKQQQ